MILNILNIENRYRRREHPFIEVDIPFSIWNGEKHIVYIPRENDKVKKYSETTDDLGIVPFYGYIISEFTGSGINTNNNKNNNPTYVIKVLGLKKNVNFPRMQLAQFNIFENTGKGELKELFVNISDMYTTTNINGFASMYEDCRLIMTMGMWSFLISLGTYLPSLISYLIQLLSPPLFFNIFRDTPQWYLAFSYGKLTINRVKPNRMNYQYNSELQSIAILPVFFPTLYDHSFTLLTCPNLGVGQVELLIGITYHHRFATNINLLGFGKKSYNVLSSVSYLEHTKLNNYFSFTTLNPPFLFKRSTSFDFSPVFLQNTISLIFYNEPLQHNYLKYNIENLTLIPDYQNLVNNMSSGSALRILSTYYRKIFHIIPSGIQFYKENSIINYPNFIDYDSYYDIDLGIATELVYDIQSSQYIDTYPSENINIFISGNVKSGYGNLKLLKLNVKPKTKVCFFNVKSIKSFHVNDKTIVKIIRIPTGKVENISYPNILNINNLPLTDIKQTIIYENEIPYYVNSILVGKRFMLFTLITFIPSNQDNFNELVILPLDIVLFSLLPSGNLNHHIQWLKVFHYKKTKELKHNIIVKENILRNVKIRIFKGKVEKSEEVINHDTITSLNLKEITLLNELNLQNVSIFTVPSYHISIENDVISNNFVYNLLAFNKLIKFIYNITYDANNKDIFDISYKHTTLYDKPYVIEVDEKGNKKEIDIKIKAISNFSSALNYIHFRESYML